MSKNLATGVVQNVHKDELGVRINWCDVINLWLLSNKCFTFIISDSTNRKVFVLAAAKHKPQKHLKAEKI